MKIKDSIKSIVDFCTAKYEWALSLLLRIDDVQIKKERFYRKVLKYSYGDDSAKIDSLLEKAMASTLVEVLDQDQLKKYYSKMMRRYGFMAFCSSFVLTLVPDITWVMILSGVVDFIVFQILLYRAMQKILMLYGDDCDLNKDEDSGVTKIITLESSGLMIGKYPFLQKMKSILGWLSKQIVQRLGPRVTAKLSRTFFIVIRRQAIKWFSVVLAKENVSLMFDSLIPFTCAIISGIVNAIILVPMCNKLRKHLIEPEAQ